ncbi:MAG: 2-methoxy-6-polyprenyl-1,4-benzoquinol methylase, mitochondrial [Chlamydiae bacterium]|nr:2-methoxy-6-polyprenyl-1,4-benzoquinol methylase, mitochondrial [Chlamydiota bacterium]
MGREVNLLVNYPQSKRNVKERGASKTEADRKIAREFGEDFFDGDRKHGYGGFMYHPRFWENVIPTFQKFYGLTSNHSILDVGCGKGFMLYDFRRLIPEIKVKGVDVSTYAIENGMEPIQESLTVGDARQLNFEDNSFDCVISINTVHNLDKDECAKALQEIERVSKKHSFITVDAYRNDYEKEMMYHWNLTAKTILHVDEWKAFFKEIGYTGDYYWFIP